MNNKIKDINIGVSIYSMTAAYTTRLLTFDDCVRKAAEMGYEGIEIVAPQSVPGYPYPPEAWCDNFRQMMSDYNLTPICYGTYVDPGKRSDRYPTPEEIIRDTTNDMLVAKSLGFKYVRTLHEFGAETYYKMLPLCEKLDMKLVIELHNPHNPRTPKWQEYFEVMARPECKEYLGVNLDMGVMQKKPTYQTIVRAIKAGAREDKVEEIINAISNGVPENELGELNPAEKNLAQQGYYRVSNSATLEEIDMIMPYTLYIHGKFYHINEDLEETCIPYDEIIKILDRYNYKGWVSSEFEGHDPSIPMDFEPQLNRFRDMFKKYISE
ncbi:MAG: TIM barrel protein [Lachnospiraceae bacterium]|nr:TIM barrel protein [Lachnospiraceae bacterium]